MDPDRSQIDQRQDIWGPHFWFVLMTVALTYPDHANAVVKRKYYDFIQNLPLLIPNSKMGDEFSHMLDKYPVSPYLDYRDSFIKWIVFIHNRVNVKIGKPEITQEEAIKRYFHEYVPSSVFLPASSPYLSNRVRKYFVFLLVLFCLLGMVYYLYNI